jgi:hypothetical protein
VTKIDEKVCEKSHPATLMCWPSHLLAGLARTRTPVTFWDGEIAMKKIMLTAAVAAALFFVLAAGMASVPTNSPSTYQLVHSASLPPVW